MTALSSMRPWALVLAADMAAGEGAAKEPKRRLKINEMVGNEGKRGRGGLFLLCGGGGNKGNKGTNREPMSR